MVVNFGASVGSVTGTNDTSYTYDLLGRTLTMAAGGQTLTFTWDALGRQTSAASVLGTVEL